MEYEIVIGLEVHVQLLTESKIFCGCRNAFSHDPNSSVCPVCLGLPGSLPVLNERAFALGLRAALALHCEIPELTKFDRKHYYYPDLPKNYQISQYDLPLSRNGWLDIDTPAGVKRIGITRAHLEEDAGKLLHGGGESRVDLNRTGTPLLEIVSEPDLRSPAEARAYLELLKQTLLYAEVSDCNMEEGSLRCDANISLRPRGETRLGVKNEIKNMNSFRGAEQALTLVAAELERALRAGETVRQVTWGYSIEKQKIFSMRVKEEANDYRYFPDPDLPAVRVSRKQVEAARRELPELPREKQARLAAEYGLAPQETAALAQDRRLADYFEAVVAAGGPAKESANWVINDVLRELKNLGAADVRGFPLETARLGQLVRLAAQGVVNMPTAREIFAKMLGGDAAWPEEIVARDGLAQVSDAGAIEAAVAQVLADNPGQAAEVRGGKHQAAMWFVGQAMRAMGGKADPRAVTRAVAAAFGIDPELLGKPKKK